MKKDQSLGKGSVRDPSIPDSGIVELTPEREVPDPYGGPGDTITHDAVDLKYVQMSKVLPFGEFASLTERIPNSLSNQINFVLLV